MLNYIQSAVLVIMLLVASFQDIKNKMISIYPVILGGILCIVLVICEGYFNLMYSVLGAGIGVIVYFISIGTKGAIGIGDAYVFIVLGASLGVQKTFLVLFFSFFFAAIVSMVLLVSKKVSKKQTIPFMPYIMLGYLGVLLL